MTAGVFGAALLLLNRRALAQPSQTDHLARTLHLVSPNLTTTVGLVLTGASLAIEWGDGDTTRPGSRQSDSQLREQLASANDRF